MNQTGHPTVHFVLVFSFYFVKVDCLLSWQEKKIYQDDASVQPMAPEA